MNNQLTTKLFQENNRDINSLKIDYDFSGISGLFVPNTLFSNQVQFGSIGLNYYVNDEYYPGIFISCYNEQNYTGSGIFQGENALKVINNLTGDSITLFYNVGKISCDNNFIINSQPYNIPSGYVQVISYIESKNNTEPFEIILGLNDANKITLDFSGRKNNLNEIYKNINPSEIAAQNILSLSINQNIIEYTYFDIIEDEINNKSIILNNNYFKQPKNIYIGNIPTGKRRANYTGYFGLVDDFIAYNEYIDLSFSEKISKLFIKTGENTGYTNITSITYDIIQSGYLNPTGILGTGITGYQLILSDEVINSSCGDNCIVYVKSGVTGLLTGEKIEYAVVNQEQINTSQQQIIYDLYNENYASRFTKNHIIFTPRIDDQDIYNINLYRDVTNKIEIPNYSLLNNIYITTDNINNKSKLIFFNGVSIPTGGNSISGGYFLSGDNKFIINMYTKSINDTVLYSASDYTGSAHYKLSYTGESKNELFEFKYDPQNVIYPETFNYLKSGNPNPSVFLNGQKLLNNYQYNYNFDLIQPFLISGGNITGTYGFGGGGPETYPGYGPLTAFNANGNILAIGVPHDFTGADLSSAIGAVYIFTGSGNSWNRTQILRSPNLGLSRRFGAAVALSANGNILAVSEPRATVSFSNAGRIILYTGDNNGNFIFSNVITSSSPITSAEFGSNIALNANGNIMAVGSPNRTSSYGRVEIYTGDLLPIFSSRVITPINVQGGVSQTSIRFGTSVQLNASGDILAFGVSASSFVTGAFFASGAVIIYTGTFDSNPVVLNLSGFLNSGLTNIDPSITSTQFGHRVALNAKGNTLAVSTNCNTGIVMIYTGINNNWIPTKLITGKNFQQVFAFNAKGDLLAIAAPDDKDLQGKVELYSNKTGNWELNATFMTNINSGAKFGRSIAFNKNDALLITSSGSIPNTQTTGIGYIYNRYSNISSININPENNLATGELFVYFDNNITGITGSNIKYMSPSGIIYNNERIWLNGIYQNKNENYILTSCSNSLLLTQNELYSKTEPLFTGDYYRFFQV